MLDIPLCIGLKLQSSIGNSAVTGRQLLLYTKNSSRKCLALVGAKSGHAFIIACGQGCVALAVNPWISHSGHCLICCADWTVMLIGSLL